MTCILIEIHSHISEDFLCAVQTELACPATGYMPFIFHSVLLIVSVRDWLQLNRFFFLSFDCVIEIIHRAQPNQTLWESTNMKPIFWMSLFDKPMELIRLWVIIPFHSILNTKSRFVARLDVLFHRQHKVKKQFGKYRRAHYHIKHIYCILLH